MSHPWNEIRLIDAIGPTKNNSSQTGTYVSLKHTNKAYIVVHLCQATTDVTTVYPYQATAIAGTSAKVFTNTLPIWYSNGCSSDETLTKGTAATSFTFSSSTGDKMCIFEVPPGQMDLANGFDCLNVRVTASSSSNVVSGYYYLQMRYKEDDTPSVFAN